MKKDIESREDIELLVKTFYNRLLADDKINYFFNDVAQTNWETHFPKMYDFWETNLLFKQLYKGNPLKSHIEVDEQSNFEQKHFGYWLQHWFNTVDELFEGEKAVLAKERARKMSHTIFMRIFMSRGVA